MKYHGVLILKPFLIIYFLYRLNTYMTASNCFSVCNEIKIKCLRPCLVWLSRLNASLLTKGSLVRFPVRAYAWVVGQVPSWGPVRGNHILLFLSLSFSLPSPLSINKFLTKNKMSFKTVMERKATCSQWCVHVST